MSSVILKYFKMKKVCPHLIMSKKYIYLLFPNLFDYVFSSITDSLNYNILSDMIFDGYLSG